jgi:hypothetical protein
MSHTHYDTMEKKSSFTSSLQNTYASVDASRVRALGEGLSRAHRNEKATFTVDTRDAGMFIVLICHSLE